VRFAPGTRVRARAIDPDHHTRLPLYVRGQLGEVVMQEGVFPLADDCARGIEPAAAEMVYTVRFPAAALWGTGTHTVLLNLWESYLEEAG
jgi:nitrile hydratase subunit beta